jgi:uncharacterized membrane protein YdcZ (DUF606 family)
MQSRLLFIVIALALGAVLPMQAAINSRLAKTAGSPIMSAFVSFAVGTIALMLFLILSGQFKFGFVSSQSPWWIWTGGLLGTFFVAGIFMYYQGWAWFYHSALFLRDKCSSPFYSTSLVGWALQ